MGSDNNNIFVKSQVLSNVQADETAYRYALIAGQCIQLQTGHPYLDKIRVPFLKLAESLSG